MKTQRLQALVARIVGGDRRLAAKLMRDVDDGFAELRPLLAELYAHTGRAHIVGVTGNPGAGKSTLVDQLIRAYRTAGKSVGVVAVDPSSPFSGGAILGDRIRMQAHATDPAVFIRSVATRGHLGGLSRSTDDIVNILDAMGCDVVLVETVGVGQDEVDIIRTAHTAVVVLVPGLGDEVQALKAGILEIADLFAVNKADREGAERTVSEIETMLALRDTGSAMRDAVQLAAGHHGRIEDDGPASDPVWRPPVLKVVATSGHGVAALVEQIAAHRAQLASTPELALRLAHRAREVFVRLLHDELWRHGVVATGRVPDVDAAVARIVERRSDPYREAAQLCAQVLGRPAP